MRVDLNADMGEGFGDWRMGDDDALLDVVTSANVACGAHAGDWDVMARTMTRARDRGVGIGAHPGFPDLQGFGRRRMAMPLSSVANLVIWQFGAARAMAASLGTQVRHFKLHGALANMASEDPALAAAAYQAAMRSIPMSSCWCWRARRRKRWPAIWGPPGPERSLPTGATTTTPRLWRGDSPARWSTTRPRRRRGWSPS